jgi:hypothetical protein
MSGFGTHREATSDESPHPPPAIATQVVQLDTHSVQLVTQSISVTRNRLLRILFPCRCRQMLPIPKFLAKRIRLSSSGKYPGSVPPPAIVVFMTISFFRKHIKKTIFKFPEKSY